MACLALHAWRIAEILNEPEVAGSMVVGEGWWSRVADWLTMASGLKALIVDTGRFDGAMYMCRGAAEEESLRSKRLMALATELTRLTYVMYALESAQAFIRAPRITNSPGRFSAVAAFTASHWNERPAPVHYDCALGGPAARCLVTRKLH